MTTIKVTQTVKGSTGDSAEGILMLIRVEDKTELHRKGQLVKYNNIVFGAGAIRDEIKIVERDTLNNVHWHEITPVIISETEDLIDGDITYNCHKREIIRNPIVGKTRGLPREGFYRVLVRPEDFSDEQVESIVDGKLQDGSRVLIECEEIFRGKENGTEVNEKQIVITEPLNFHIDRKIVDESWEGIREKLYVGSRPEDNTIDWIIDKLIKTHHSPKRIL